MLTARLTGAATKANVGMSNDKRGERPLRRKTKVSSIYANQIRVSRVLRSSRKAKEAKENKGGSGRYEIGMGHGPKNSLSAIGGGFNRERRQSKWRVAGNNTSYSRRHMKRLSGMPLGSRKMNG